MSQDVSTISGTGMYSVCASSGLCSSLRFLCVAWGGVWSHCDARLQCIFDSHRAPFLRSLFNTPYLCVCVCVCVRAYTCVCVYVHVYVCASVIACMSVFNVHAAHRIFSSYFSLSCIWGCVDPLRIFFFFKGERQTMTKTDRQWERQRERVHEKEMDRHRQQEQRRWWCVEVT